MKKNEKRATIKISTKSLRNQIELRHHKSQKRNPATTLKKKLRAITLLRNLQRKKKVSIQKRNPRSLLPDILLISTNQKELLLLTLKMWIRTLLK